MAVIDSAPGAILHLLSNFRWTERAEPAANLALAEQRAGRRVLLACGSPPPRRPNLVAIELKALGLPHVVWEMPKHFGLMPLLRDAMLMRDIVQRQHITVVHCHMLNAHLTAAAALRNTDQRPRIVRTAYEPEGLAPMLRERYLLRTATDGLIVLTAEARNTMTARCPRLGDRIALIEPGIDLVRFSPDRRISPGTGWPDFPPDAFVVGIVSRLRKDRRVDVVIDAVASLARECPQIHLMIVGRGGPEEIEEAVTRPLARAGCADRVHMAGFRRGDELIAGYRRMDALAYPAPGTDKSCRTVREAMAAGVAVIGARVGYVPYLIDHEITGLLVDQNADAFACAIRRLYDDRLFQTRLKEAALSRARERFSLALQAERTLAFYASLA